MLKAIETAERDTNKFRLAFVFVISAVIIFILGHESGRFEVRKEAVQHGHADWNVDQNNNMVFKWRAAR